MTKQTRMIQYVVFNQGNSLIHSATRGTSLHLQVGVLIRKFGNFTDSVRNLTIDTVSLNDI